MHTQLTLPPPAVLLSDQFAAYAPQTIGARSAATPIAGPDARSLIAPTTAAPPIAPHPNSRSTPTSPYSSPVVTFRPMQTYDAVSVSMPSALPVAMPATVPGAIPAVIPAAMPGVTVRPVAAGAGTGSGLPSNATHASRRGRSKSSLEGGGVGRGVRRSSATPPAPTTQLPPGAMAGGASPMGQPRARQAMPTHTPAAARDHPNIHTTATGAVPPMGAAASPHLMERSALAAPAHRSQLHGHISEQPHLQAPQQPQLQAHAPHLQVHQTQLPAAAPRATRATTLPEPAPSRQQ